MIVPQEDPTGGPWGRTRVRIKSMLSALRHRLRREVRVTYSVNGTRTHERWVRF